MGLFQDRTAYVSKEQIKRAGETICYSDRRSSVREIKAIIDRGRSFQTVVISDDQSDRVREAILLVSNSEEDGVPDPRPGHTVEFDGIKFKVGDIDQSAGPGTHRFHVVQIKPKNRNPRSLRRSS